MNKALSPDLIEVTGNELQFIRKHAPTAFPRLLSEALTKDGISIDRVTIHKELHTIKDRYDSRIITKARELLKTFSNAEFQPE
ncbi:hypothetical protein [Sphingobacterium mizutaii]|uniref:hypothetical protein n=1 Tax=Sphingobacterium mizutaii TaxID=1010 RepID=UPI003D98B397